MNLSFAGCGFSGLYHLGVVECLRKHAPTFVEGLNVIAGASAGALAATMLATGMAADSAIKVILESTSEVRSSWLNNFHPSFNLMSHVEECLETFLPDDAYKAATDRLSVSLTTCGVLSRENFLAEKFDTRQELINAVCGSCYVPVWGGYASFPYKYRGAYYMDGGFSDNCPQSFPGETITVSPFAGESDICPESSHPGLDFCINLKNTPFDLSLANLHRLKESLFLPSTLILVELMRQGYNNCLAYLQSRGLDECSGESCKEAAHWKNVVPASLHDLVLSGDPCSLPVIKSMNSTGYPCTATDQQGDADDGYFSVCSSRQNSTSVGSTALECLHAGSAKVDGVEHAASLRLDLPSMVLCACATTESLQSVTTEEASDCGPQLHEHPISPEPGPHASKSISGKAMALSSSVLSRCAYLTNWVLGRAHS